VRTYARARENIEEICIDILLEVIYNNCGTAKKKRSLQMDYIQEFKKKRKKEIQREYEVVKANTLVQRSKFYLTTQEQKIILYLVSKIKPNDEEFKLYEFSIHEFCNVCEIDYDNGKNYKNIKETLRLLADKSIWVTLDDGRETILRWVERPYIEPQSGIIQIKLDNLMMPYLMQLRDNYTKYSLYFVLAMKSQYSIRLYELLKSYEFRGGCEFDIDDFKKKMGAEKYKQHNDFKRNVLDIAIKEINGHSDISVS
jgi:plasmid replication initiation protein